MFSISRVLIESYISCVPAGSREGGGVIINWGYQYQWGVEWQCVPIDYLLVLARVGEALLDTSKAGDKEPTGHGEWKYVG